MTHAARTVPGTENINGFLVRSLPRVSVAALATPACVPADAQDFLPPQVYPDGSVSAPGEKQAFD